MSAREWAVAALAALWLWLGQVDAAPQAEPRAAAAELPGLELAGGAELDRFFGALRGLDSRAATAAVRVAHFGDSHVAADLLTARVRQLLVSRFGGAGRGFLMFGKPYRDYSPAEASVGSTAGWTWSNGMYFGTGRSQAGNGIYGLSGFSQCAEAEKEEGWVSLRSQAVPVHVTIYYALLPDGGELEVVAGKLAAVPISTAGAVASLAAYELDLAADDPKAVLVRTTGSRRVCLFGMTAETAAPGIVYDDLGINGARITTLGRFGEPFFKQMLGHRDYSLIILSYGTNEAQDADFDAGRYRQKGEAVLAMLKEADPGADCLLVGPPVSGVKRKGERFCNANLEPMSGVLKELAVRFGCGWFDQLKWMGGCAAFEEWMDKPAGVVARFRSDYRMNLDVDLVSRSLRPDFRLYGKDVVHLSTSGYQLVADLFFDSLMRGYEDYLRKVSAGTGG